MPSDYGGRSGTTIQQMCGKFTGKIYGTFNQYFYSLPAVLFIEICLVADDFRLLLRINMPWLRARQTYLASDESKRVGSRQDDFGIDGSFRKLAVD